MRALTATHMHEWHGLYFNVEPGLRVRKTSNNEEFAVNATSTANGGLTKALGLKKNTPVTTPGKTGANNGCGSQ